MIGTGFNEIMQMFFPLAETNTRIVVMRFIAAIQAGVTYNGNCSRHQNVPSSTESRVRRSLKAAGLQVIIWDKSLTAVLDGDL